MPATEGRNIGLDAAAARRATIGFVVVALLVKSSVNFSDVTGFFVPAIERFLADPLHVYGFRRPVFGFDFPLSYPPLYLVVFAPFVAIAKTLSLDDFSAAGAVVFYLPILAADLGAVAVLERLLRTAGVSAGAARLTAVAYLYNPFLWFASVYMLHQEGMLLGLGLLAFGAVMARRWLLAGFLLAAALLLKTTAILFLIPVVALLLGSGERRAALVVAVTATVSVLLVMLPFLIADANNVVYSLARFEQLRPAFGIGLAKFFVGTPWDPLMVAGSGALALAAAAGAGGWLAWRTRSFDLHSLVAAALLCHLAAALFFKWNYAHYHLPLVGLALAWDQLARAADPGPPWRSWFGTLLLFLVLSPFPPEVLTETNVPVLLRSVAYVGMLGAAIATVARHEQSRATQSPTPAR